jgi:hypothetical protein
MDSVEYKDPEMPPRSFLLTEEEEKQQIELVYQA